MEHLRALETYDLRMDDENQEILMNKNIDGMKSNNATSVTSPALMQAI